MRDRAMVPLIGLLLSLAVVRPTRAVDNLASQERLGGRIGYIETFDGVNAYWGNGWDVTLMFNEHLFDHLFLDIHVGAIYLGDILDPELDDFITKTPNVESEMRTFYFSVGLVYGFPLGMSGYTITTSAAAGIYSTSVAFAADFVADDLSDQYFGGNGSLGLVKRVGTSWSLEATGTVHYFDTKAGYDDLLWVFTKTTAQDPIMLGISFGVLVDLR